MSNELIIEELQQLEQYYAEKGDDGRSTAYRRAIESIHEYGRPIKSGKQAQSLKWIGKSIGAKIDEVLGYPEINDSTHSRSRSRSKSHHTRKEETHSLELEEDVNVEQMFSVTLVDESKHRSRSPVHKRDYNDRRSRNTPRRPQPSNNNFNFDSGRNLNPSKKTKIEMLDAPHSRVAKTNRMIRLPDRSGEYNSKPRFTRRDIGSIKLVFEKVWNKLSPRGFVEVCGTYRRGMLDNYSVEIVLCDGENSPKARLETMKTLINALYRARIAHNIKQQRVDNFLVTYTLQIDLSRIVDNKSFQTGEEDYYGKDVSQSSHVQKKQFIPASITCTDSSAWGSALIFRTGPASFCNKIQQIARSKGYELQENGLYYRGKRLMYLGRGSVQAEGLVLDDINVPFIHPSGRS